MSLFGVLSGASDLDWAADGADWPNRAASRFVQAAGLRWHVQEFGQGPNLLLLHGAGASTHSWRDLAPRLANDFRVVALDLPGHGFTQTPSAEGLTLDGMTKSIAELTQALNFAPDVIVGHSAGAAIGLSLHLLGTASVRAIISLNGALSPFPGAAAQIFPLLAKLLFINPAAISMFAWRAGQPGVVERLIQSTGSRLDAQGIAGYRKLLGSRRHIAATLGMMSGWDLLPLRAKLARIDLPVVLFAGETDAAVPPEVSREVARLIPGVRFELLPGLGHLAHEEAPEAVVQWVREAAEAGLAARALRCERDQQREALRHVEA